jgi:hypothetical protein
MNLFCPKLTALLRRQRGTGSKVISFYFFILDFFCGDLCDEYEFLDLVFECDEYSDGD